MTNANTNIYIHLTWATKYRIDLLRDRKYFNMLCNHILENAKRKRINIDCIGGAVNHIHVLLRLYQSDNVGMIVKLIKGESSWWAKRNIKELENFEWQSGYDARSVHFTELEPVRRYILNQENHHAGM